MTHTNEHYRMMIYSHDTFGLGHLRRCRRLAHAFVEKYQNLSVLILSGCPIIGSFDFKPRVDFVRIPGIQKQADGTYDAYHLGLPVQDVLTIRRKILLKSTQAFKPHLFLVDKEPWGLQGELKPTLHWLKEKGVPTLLGLRDVLDDPETLAKEWKRKGAFEALESIYDQLWIYGPKTLYNPLKELPLSKNIMNKTHFTGYLCKPDAQKSLKLLFSRKINLDEPFILVTTGGGGDGDQVTECVLKTYEQYGHLLWPALIILGPFMSEDLKKKMLALSEQLPFVEIVEFEKELEAYMSKASAVVAMGGYNTFCEILELNKPALMIPRTFPRKEQFIRAKNAEKLGLISYVSLEEVEHNPEKLYERLEALKYQKKPAEVINLHQICYGVDVIYKLMEDLLPHLKNMSFSQKIRDSV
jgi:predicted glycosyltransferase